MLDYRIYTFLKLCELMNYRKTAEALNMTQPAVTQHIQGLEELYKHKLFSYKGKTLSKTSEAIKLENHARSIVYNEKRFQEEIDSPRRKKVSIGATKTIGHYVVDDKFFTLLKNEDIEFEFIIDNTRNLFDMLNSFQLNLLLVEGYFDKSNYDYQLIRDEELIGICAANHPFAGKEITIEEIFNEQVLLREKGSGTREVFENLLKERNYSIERIERKAVISSFGLMVKVVEEGIGISFVYEAAAKKSKNVAVFRIKGNRVSHELNYVYLKNSNVADIIELFE